MTSRRPHLDVRPELPPFLLRPERAMTMVDAS